MFPSTSVMLLHFVIVGVIVVSGTITKGIPKNACVNYYRDGDFILGGLFPLRYVYPPNVCAGEGAGLSSYGIKSMEAMVFAVRYINSLKNILPNVTLGFDIRDECRSEYITLFQSTTLATSTGAEEFQKVCGFHPNGNISRQILGIIGGSDNSGTQLAAHVGSINKIPVISYGAGGDDLSDTRRFPFFTRTVPPESTQVTFIVDLLLYLDWVYIGVLYSRDSEGLFNSQNFKSQAESQGICISYFEPVSLFTSDKDMNELMKKIKGYDKASVLIMLIFDNEVFLKVLRAMDAKGLTNTVSIICVTGCGHGLVSRGFGNATYGALIIRSLSERIPPLDTFYNSQDPNKKEVSPWLHEYWLDSGGRRPIPYGVGENIMNAVGVVAYGLDAYLQKTCSGDLTICKMNWIDTEMLFGYIKNVSFQTILGDTFQFNGNGEARAVYELQNMQLVERKYGKKVVAQWYSDKESERRLNMDTDIVHFKNGIGNVPRSICREDCNAGSYPIPLARKCCWGCRQCLRNAIVVNGTCRKCLNTHWPDITREHCVQIEPDGIDWSDPIVKSVLVLAGFGFLISVLVYVGLAIFINHPLIKSTSRELSVVNIVGLVVTLITVIVCLIRPSIPTCIIFESVLALSFTITYAPTMLKVNRIYRIFRSGQKSVRRPRWIGPRPQICLCFAMIGIQIIISVVSSAISPCSPTLLIPIQPRNHLEVYCSFGSGFIASVVYNLLIVLICCYYAFRARKVPSNYNESRFIAISVYSTLVLSLATVPVYLTSQEILPKLTTICLALLLNSYQTLACVYLPKLYAIVFVGEGLNVDDWRSTLARTINNSRVQPTNTSTGGTFTASEDKKKTCLTGDQGAGTSTKPSKTSYAKGADCTKENTSDI